MKIYFIIASLGKPGGTERVATTLANSLVAHYDITILSRYCDNNAYDLNSEVNDIKHHGNTLSFLSQVKNKIQTDKPDMVVIHTMGKLTPALLLANIKAAHIVSLEHITYKFHSPLLRFCRKKLYKKLYKVLVLTESDRRNYMSFHNSVHVIPNPTSFPITTRRYDLQSNIILAIGRLTPQKGFDLLLQAWRHVENKTSEWQLHIYGDGEQREKLIKLSNRLNLSRAHFKGISSNIIDVYDRASVLVSSSRFEGFAMVLVEAQSRGLPIVSFDYPCGPEDIISNNINGILVENGNTAKMAEAIIELINNKNKRLSFSQNAQKSAKEYLPERITQKWVDLINNISQ